MSNSAETTPKEYNCTILAILAVPFLFFLVPLMEGRAWNALGPHPFQILNPPEGYTGHIPEVPITAESWGASAVELGFRARLNYCIRNLELPLWNPNQGLGQPFAAQGEGSPYFPIVILRVLLPYTWANFVSLAFYYFAAVTLYSFLRGLSVSRAASVFGSWAFMFSGALTLNLARFNYSDQLCMIPIIFWAAARAIRSGTLSSHLVLSAAAFLHLLGGLVQIAMPSALVCGAFCVHYAWVTHGSRGRWILSAATALLFFTLGNGLGAFSLLPLLEAIQTTFSKNPEMLSMLPMPYANAIALFFPQIFGKYFESWIPGSYPQIIAWDDLFAFAGTLVAMLVAVGWSSCKGWKAEGNRLVFLFFSLMGVFLVLRYISFPPVAIVNMLPVIGRQSPKHAGGITVFCFAAAAALVVDSLRSIWSPRAHLCLGILVTAMASSVLTLMVREGGRATANLELARIPILFTIIVIAVLWIMIGLAARAADTEGAGWALAAMVVAELTIYIPMGAASDDFLWARCGMFCASVPFAILVSRRKYRAAIFSGLVVLGFFACFLVPRSKLPDNVDLTQPPRSVLWLKEHARNDARSWGIQPDLSSISRIQDLGAIGPLAPFAFNDFVKLIADATLYGNYKISCYNLLGAYYWSYPLALYLQNKPIFDAAGLRYLFLNKDYFGPGKRYNDSVLLPPPASLAVVYEDDRVRILESKEAKAKVQFHAAFSVMPSVPAIIERFRSLPLSIFGPPMISADDQQIPIPLPHDYPATVAFLSYRPNSVEVTTNSAVPGLLVLNDIYDRAWHVSIDGGEQTLLRVNAFFRGVYVPTGGTHEILFFYRPIAFVRGVDLSLVVLIFLFVGVIAATRSKDPLRLISDGQIDVGTVRWALAKTYCVVGIALSAAILTLIFLTYFHSA